MARWRADIESFNLVSCSSAPDKNSALTTGSGGVVRNNIQKMAVRNKANYSYGRINLYGANYFLVDPRNIA